MKIHRNISEGYIGLSSGTLDGIAYNISVTVSLYSSRCSGFARHKTSLFRPVRILVHQAHNFRLLLARLFPLITGLVRTRPRQLLRLQRRINLAAAYPRRSDMYRDACVCCCPWYAFSWHDYAMIESLQQGCRSYMHFEMRWNQRSHRDTKETFSGTNMSIAPSMQLIMY